MAGGAGILWAIVWILLLIFLGWPIAFLVAGIWICLMPFAVCMDFLKDIQEALQKVVNLPTTFAENIVSQKPLCS